MSTELAPVTFAEKVTNKVRKLIMDAMPEEKIQGILNAEYAKYFVDTSNRYGTVEPSPFSRLIESEIRKQMEAKIKTEVNTFLCNMVNNTNEQAKEVLAAITPAVLDAMAKKATMDIAQTFVYGLQQTLAMRQQY